LGLETHQEIPCSSVTFGNEMYDFPKERERSMPEIFQPDHFYKEYFGKESILQKKH
jgi:hypothetical protein